MVEETGLDLPVYFSANTVNRLLLTRGKREGYGMRDFVYAPGLYESLPHGKGRMLTSVLYDFLAPGGHLVIGNVAAQADGHGFLDLICRVWATRSRCPG